MQLRSASARQAAACAGRWLQAAARVPHLRECSVQDQNLEGKSRRWLFNAHSSYLSCPPSLYSPYHAYSVQDQNPEGKYRGAGLSFSVD